MGIRNPESLTSFEGNISEFICPSENSVFLCNNPKRIKSITRSRLVLSHLREYKFKHNFQDTLNSICNCGEDIGSSCHYVLHCWFYTNEGHNLLNDIQDIDKSILKLSDSRIVGVLLHGRKFLDISSDSNILNATMDFLSQNLSLF